MIWKVLKNNIKPGQLAGTFLGVMLGLTILMGALSFYLDVKPVFDDKESFWKDEYIIINKRIKVNDTYNQATNESAEKPLFSDEEIAALKDKSFVKDVAEFSSCSFKIQARSDSESALTGFSADLFFEAVPDEYIDVNYDNWKWEEDSKFVPAILPKTYLNLYNFGFAQSQNLPQVAEESAGLIKFNIIIYNSSKQQQFETRIVGFSERINTILVPKDFVEWGNKNFGSDPDPSPGRLIVVSDDPANPELLDYINSNNYDVNKSELSNSKALAFLKITTTIVLIIGLIIILLAFSLMVISIQLLLHRNNENIRKLSLLGYKISEIALPYKIMTIVLFVITFTISLIPLSIFRDFYSSNLILLGYEIFSQMFISIIVPGFGFISIIVIMLIWMIHAQVKKITS
ncbi:MAG: hypothetical protein C0596_14405 [Marinilabiliales bacterium]|nr:MAG: hypothetical protein C0596_14405 [Marinilabiliales bacterium]